MTPSATRELKLGGDIKGKFDPRDDFEGLITFTYKFSNPGVRAYNTSTHQYGFIDYIDSNEATVVIQVGKAVRVDLSIEGLEDETEDQGFGALIALNDDDDNQNQVEDLRELKGPAVGEDDLTRVSIDYWLRDDAYAPDFTAFFRYGEKIRLWTTDKKDKEIISEVEFLLTDLPSEVYVEGIERGGSSSLKLITEAPSSALFTDMVVPDITLQEGDTTEEDTVRVTVTTADLDISHVTTGIVPEPLEEDPGGLVAVLESNANNLLQQPADWVQPHTRFVVVPDDLLAEGGYLTLEFPANLVVWEVMPDNSERQIISGVTHLATDRVSIFYSYGLSKSASERDAQVLLQLNDLTPEALTLDRVKVTIVDAFFEINVTTFIPYDAFYAPIQTITEKVTGGDNRGFNRVSTDFRTRHVVMTTPFIEFDVDGLLGEKKGDGWSREYDAPTSLMNYDPNQTDPTQLQLKTIAKNEAEIEANRGGPYKTDWARGDGSSLVHTMDRISSRKLHLFFNGDESNPLWDTWVGNLSPGITYEFEMILDATDVLHPILRFEAAHDGFPAYELYIDTTTIYQHDPRNFNQSVYDLYPEMDFYQPFKQINVGW